MFSKAYGVNLSVWQPICVNGLQQVSTTQERQKEKPTDDLLVISDRDQLAEAVYMAAVETGAVVGAK